MPSAPRVRRRLRSSLRFDPGLPGALRASRPRRSSDNNFTGWRFNQPFLEWTKDYVKDAHAALAHVWDGHDPTALNVTTFASTVVSALPRGGVSTTITLASVLLMAIDGTKFPPYRYKAFKRVYGLVGFERPMVDSEPGVVWHHAMTFLDRLLQEAAERGLVLRDRLDAQGIVWTIFREFEMDTWTAEDKRRFQAFLGAAPLDDEDDDAARDPLVQLAEELYLDVRYLRRIETLLRDKRQVIFCGPPGTGKTYVANKLAAYFSRGGGSVEKVQFHPSYAYEDFVEGFRPHLLEGQAGFKLMPGPVRRIAKVAEETPNSTCVLLIDEINRGNVAKVFGELYYLLEYRNEELSLLYSAEKARLPDNLWIIGTMNTADRSIALVDAALRRRFHFVSFYPDKPPVKGLLARWLADTSRISCGWPMW